MRLIRFLVNATKYTDGHQRLLALEDVLSSNPLARPSFDDDVVFPIGSDHSSAAAAEMVKRRRRFQSDKDIDDGEALSCGCGRPTRTAATPPPPTSLHSSRSAWRLSMPSFLLISAWLPGLLLLAQLVCRPCICAWHGVTLLPDPPSNLPCHVKPVPRDKEG